MPTLFPTMKGKVTLTSFTDWLGNEVKVGDHVIAVRVPDRTPQMYTGQVMAIRENYDIGWNDKMILQIHVLPTGRYSTSWARHGDYGAALKANWIQSQNVVKLLDKSLDTPDEEE